MIYKAKMPEAWARMEWRRATFGPEVRGGDWWRHRGNLYFRGEQNYTWFLLKFS
jgi:hypothetical protein